MAKVNFTKVEGMFTETLRKIWIDRLSELASIVNLMLDPDTKPSKGSAEKIIKSFHSELKRLKERDKSLYARLEIGAGEEARFSVEPKSLTADDWSYLKQLKEKIDDLKKELYGQVATTEQDEARIEKERARHINKRFNIRDGWLPLH